MNECIQLKIFNYHFILKRILWFTIPYQYDINNQLETFINFMYNQIIPDYLEGLMIIFNDNHFSQQLIEDISLIAALQFRASHKLGLPSIKEIKHLLPKTILQSKDIHPQKWAEHIHQIFQKSVESLSITQAKIKFLSMTNLFHPLSYQLGTHQFQT